MANGGADHRISPRVPIELKVEYKRLNSFFADYTKNISKGGTFIKTSRALPIGTEFIFKLAVPELAGPLQLRGQVIWIVKPGEPPPPERPDITDPGMGIRFIYAEDEQRERVASIVEQLMVKSLGPLLYTKLMSGEE